MSAEYAESPDAGERWTESPDNMQIRRDLAKRVASDLSRNEQETTLSFFGDSDRARLVSYRPSIVRPLLRHEYAPLEWVYERPSESAGGRVAFPMSPSRAESLGDIEAVSVLAPLGTLSVKGVPRKRDTHAGIVATPEVARSAFGGDDE